MTAPLENTASGHAGRDPGLRPSQAGEDGPGKRPSGELSAAFAVAVYTAMTVIFLWPLSRDPAALAIPNGDVYGNAWTLAWVARQATRDPVHLFDANIYHPYRGSLAFAESLLPQSAQAAPVLLAGGGPLLAHNVVVLLTFPLCGLAMFLLAREMSGSRSGALIAGAAYAFSAYRFAHLVHVQTLSAQWLPLALLFTRRSLATGSRRHALAAGAFAALQALSSGYYAVLLAAALAVLLLWEGRAAIRRRTAMPVIVALAAAAAVAVCVYLPHRRVIRGQEELRGYEFTRGREDMVRWSAAPSSILDPGAHVVLPHQKALARVFGRREPLYPTLAVAVLAALGALAGTRDSRLAALLAATGFAFALGPEVRLGSVAVPGPFDLLRHLPVVAMLRAPSRFAPLALLGLDLLAAIGWARLSGRASGMAARFGLAALLVAELFPAGLHHSIRREAPPPPTVEWLARAPDGVVLELPWDHETYWHAARYTYWSTAHWKRMVNGWGSFEPKGCFNLGVTAKMFPSPFTARELRRAGVRYVVIHLDHVPAPRRERILATEDLPPGVRLAADLGPHRIYEIDPRDPPRRRDTLAGGAGARPLD